VDVVRDLVEFQFQQHLQVRDKDTLKSSAVLTFYFLQAQQHMGEFLLEEWQSIEYGLLRERGLWGPPVGSELDKWQLDLTEGPYRMRKKMIRNTNFYNHYPYRPPGSLSVSIL
jgi:hypothetical protein